MAALRTVNFGRELGFSRVILESDVHQVVQALNKLKWEKIGVGMDI